MTTAMSSLGTNTEDGKFMEDLGEAETRWKYNNDRRIYVGGVLIFLAEVY